MQYFTADAVTHIHHCSLHYATVFQEVDDVFSLPVLINGQRCSPHFLGQAAPVAFEKFSFPFEQCKARNAPPRSPDTQIKVLILLAVRFFTNFPVPLHLLPPERNSLRCRGAAPSYQHFRTQHKHPHKTHLSPPHQNGCFGTQYHGNKVSGGSIHCINIAQVHDHAL